MVEKIDLPVPPPRYRNFNGSPRSVGVEIEFAAISARDAAEAIRARFGGTVRMRDAHRYEIEGTKFGTFKCELDSRYAHPDAYPSSEIVEVDKWLASLRDTVSGLFGDIGSLIIPNEIVTPPIPVACLGEIDEVTRDLTRAGARGTDKSLFFAFGLHLNPDIATERPDWLLNVMRAELLLSRWLRGVMSIDISRQLTGFASAFPQAYAERILSPDYAPDTATLISNYIDANPSRDRELDMLPLFAWLDERSVRDRLPSEKIGRRPTFHYRLPNAALDQRHWSVSREWNRWSVIETLADRPDIMQPMAEEYLDVVGRDVFDHWSVRASDWIIAMYQSQEASEAR